jgi:hypothetical protein
MLVKVHMSIETFKFGFIIQKWVFTQSVSQVEL